jgi:hypothetical protein
MSSTPATTILSTLALSSGKRNEPINENQPPPSLVMSTHPDRPERRAITAMRLRGGFDANANVCHFNAKPIQITYVFLGILFM